MYGSEGFVIEDRFVEDINNKYFCELNANLKRLVSYALPMINKNEVIKCCKSDSLIKPDICIYQKSNRAFISIKSGLSEGMHEENILTFVDFLKENGIDDYTIETFLLFHYGDGTTDGTGTKRLSAVEVKYKLENRIQKMNDAFNASKDFVKKFADRVMWQGVNENADRAEILYHGDTDFGIFISRNDFIEFLDKRRWDYMNMCVHIGPFTLRPKARYAEREVVHSQSLKKVSIKYPRLIYDIEFIVKKTKKD